MRENYKGYVLDARPQQLAETEEWTVHVTIEKHYGDKVKTCPFFAGKPNFKTRVEAVNASLDFGKQIIDGQFRDLNVDSL